MDVFWGQNGRRRSSEIIHLPRKTFPILQSKGRRQGLMGPKIGRGDVEANVVLGTVDIDIAGITKKLKNKDCIPRRWAFQISGARSTGVAL